MAEGSIRIDCTTTSDKPVAMNWHEALMDYLTSMGEKFAAIDEQGMATAVALILVLFLVIWALPKLGAGSRRRNRSRWTAKRTGDGGKPDMSDPHRQMEAVHRVRFEVQKLLNSKEARLLPVLEDIVREIDKGHRVMAQTSMGEVLRPKSNSGTWKDRRDAYASINSKRLDFAIIDRWGKLVCAVEYQGAGHHQRKAFMRDAVKREAVRKAGVAWIEVMPGDKPSELRRQVQKALGEVPEPAAQQTTTDPAELP